MTHVYLTDNFDWFLLKFIDEDNCDPHTQFCHCEHTTDFINISKVNFKTVNKWQWIIGEYEWLIVGNKPQSIVLILCALYNRYVNRQ